MIRRGLAGDLRRGKPSDNDGVVNQSICAIRVIGGQSRVPANKGSTDVPFEFEQELFATVRVSPKFLPGQGRVQKFAEGGYSLIFRLIQITKGH